MKSQREMRDGDHHLHSNTIKEQIENFGRLHLRKQFRKNSLRQTSSEQAWRSMDPTRAQWLPAQLEVDESIFINQWQTNSINNLYFNHHSSGTHPACPASSGTECFQENFQPAMTKSRKESIKIDDFGCYTSPSSKILSFGDSNSPRSSTNDAYGKHIKTEADNMSLGEMNFSAQTSPNSIQQFYETQEYGETTKTGPNRTPLQAQDHVLAERKRRERLSERFVALATMVPGLKKLDKASVLGGAIQYLEQLKARVEVLENQKRKYEESANVCSLSKRRRLPSPDEASSSDDNSDITTDHISPEIEVTVSSETNFLVRVYCEKRCGIIKEILCEMEKLHLSILSSSVIPFGSTSLNITVIAQMDSEVSMSAKDIADTARMAIQKLM